MAPAGTHEVNGVRTGVSGSPRRQRAGCLGKGAGVGRKLGLGGGQGDALRQLVIFAGTKDRARFWAGSRGCEEQFESKKENQT